MRVAMTHEAPPEPASRADGLGRYLSYADPRLMRAWHGGRVPISELYISELYEAYFRGRSTYTTSRACWRTAAGSCAIA